MDGYVDAQIRNSEILLEVVQTYPGITTAVLAVSFTLFVGLVGWAIYACLTEKPSK